MAAVGWQRGGRPADRGRAGGRGEIWRDLVRRDQRLPEMPVEEGRRQDFSAEHRDLPRSDRHDLRRRHLTADLDRLRARRACPWTAGAAPDCSAAERARIARPPSSERQPTPTGGTARSEVIGHLPLHAVARHVDPLVRDLLLRRPCRPGPATSSVPARSTPPPAAPHRPGGAALGIAQ